MCQSCWPSNLEWKTFNSLVGGNLVKTEPIAQSCYPGPAKDLDECAYVNKMWPDQDFQSSDPIGRPYPYNITCAPVDYAAGQEPTTCTLGSLPVYAVNATTLSHIRATMAFARLRNIRLVVTGTGHDLLGRSDAVTAHHFQMAPLQKTENNTDLLDAVALMLQMLPDLNDAGFAGYGYWFRNFPTVFVGNATSDREAVQSFDNVRDAVEVMSGKPNESGANVILLSSGGQVFKDAWDKTSGLHPAWRRSHYVLIYSTGISRNASPAERKAAGDDVTFVKGAAAKKLAPNTGGYMNEGDRNDPDYKKSFYESPYNDHLKTKQRYDPSNVFYCPTCVGSEDFIERPDGPLCEAYLGLRDG
ncbi:hypothetical protein F66182_3577 [Fusarium sp. NRRL 66182]|nr:hypothetical protein F66182_3577 [Fusarium sp. NRRL 66182]